MNVFEDDIVQIAAIKVNAGKITDRFNIILHTDKQIPAMLGGIINPLLQEYERAEKVDRKTGLCAFMDFVGDCTLIGQNVEYDCNILDYNLRKDHFLGIFAANMQQHIDCLQNNSAVAELFRRAYADIYHGTLSRLYQRSFETPLLVDELEQLYGTFIQKEWITANPKMQYIFSFLRNDVISPEKTPENVIIFEATDGVYPFFDKKTPEEIRESARLFYVAMTRAKKRLHITYAESVSGISKWGNPYSIDKEPTPFLRHIKKYFYF